jgi:hypothetical protein
VKLYVAATEALRKRTERMKLSLPPKSQLTLFCAKKSELGSLGSLRIWTKCSSQKPETGHISC